MTEESWSILHKTNWLSMIMEDIINDMGKRGMANNM